jgi:hypothetical protein
MDEQELLNVFPNFNIINFIITIPLSEINKVVTTKDIIVIKYVFDCHCYYQNPRKTEYYICKKKGGGITIKDLVNCLIENEFAPQCNHIFLESFDLNSEVQVTPWFGS